MRRADARLAAEVALAELTVEVIALEAGQGWSFPGAARPLTDAEAAAKVRFADLDRIGADAAALIVRHVEAMRDPLVAALVADLQALSYGTAVDVLERLVDLASPTSPAGLAIGPLLEDTTRHVTTALASAHIAAADEVLAEARRQGVTAAFLPQRGDVIPTPGERAAMGLLARQIVEEPVGTLLAAAAHEARVGAVPDLPAGSVIDAVESTVRALGTGTLADVARQAVTRAVNTGRGAAARETPEPEEVYASELLDGKTCGPCSEVDGRMYDSLDSALTDYPSGGSYKGCLGKARCRGTLVFVWGRESAPTLDRSPYQRVRIDRTPRGPSLPDAVGDVGTA